MTMQEKLHLENLPQLVASLLEKIERLEKAVQGLGQSTIGSGASDDLMTIDEAAAFLRLTKNTLYGMVSKSKIPVSKLGKRLYFRRAELEQWVASGRRKTNAELAVDANGYLANRYAFAKKTSKL